MTDIKISPAGNGVGIVSQEMSDYSKNDENILNTLTEVLDVDKPEEITDILKRYIKVNKALCAKYLTSKTFKRVDRLDWAVAYALSPDWYDSKLTSRLQNTMLVSALLLTVAAASFLSPPFQPTSTDDGALNSSRTYRLFFYVTGLCCFFFLLSIYLGVCFIENAMSRAYTPIDRFMLILKYYHVYTGSEIALALGSFLFPAMLLIPVSENYFYNDSYYAYGLGLLYLLLVGGANKILSDDGYRSQFYRRDLFISKLLCDRDDQGYERGDLKRSVIDYMNEQNASGSQK